MSVLRSNELVLVRHGETVFGHETLLGGQTDPPLSARGHDQALRLADRLSSEEIAAVVVTPFQRTVQTAAPLVERIGVRADEVAELSEVHLGELESDSISPEGRRALMREVFRQQRWDVAAGAESSDAFAGRVAAGLGTLLRDLDDGVRVVAFVHGGVIAEACRQATCSRPLAFLPHLRHASITRIRYRDQTMSLDIFNDTAHLDTVL